MWSNETYYGAFLLTMQIAVLAMVLFAIEGIIALCLTIRKCRRKRVSRPRKQVEVIK